MYGAFTRTILNTNVIPIVVLIMLKGYASSFN